MKPCPVLCAALLFAGPPCAQAAEGPQAWALVVGSNRGGAGQEPLQYAHADAARVHEVLVQLGGYPLDHVRVLGDPDAGELSAALDDMAARLATLRARGEDSLFLFYYSGHARAQALNLGRDELPLDELRERLEGLRANVTLVVLDACQAGALSNVKGATPAADFSYNAAAGLNTEGLAVLASSSATELSQESAALGGSYFTHHLVAGLRGAADQDGDGGVTLSEAYTYAYHRTLVDTSATAVGAQHVTLETDLKGKGDMVLSRPGQASAQLVLPADLAAEVLVHRVERGTVMAELHKAAGSPMGLALVPGRYGALVRRDGDLRECAVALGDGDREILDPEVCAAVPIEASVEAKGEDRHGRLERLMVEAALGAGQLRDTPYTDRLEDFSFSRGAVFWDRIMLASGAVSWTIHPHMAAVLTAGTLDGDSWSREMYTGAEEPSEESFDWTTWRASAQFRVGYPLLRGWLVPYAQAGLGPAWANTTWDDVSVTDRQVEWGWHAAAAAGLQVMPRVRGWRHLGVFGQVEQTYAPVLENLLGDRHDSGRLALLFGLRAGF